MGATGAQTKHLFCESHTCSRAGHWLKHEFFFYLIKCLVPLLRRDLLSKLGVCISSVDSTDCLGSKRVNRNTSMILSIMRNNKESTLSLQERFGYENVELSLSQDVG